MSGESFGADVSSLSARDVAWRLLPAIVALLMLLFAPTDGIDSQQAATASPARNDVAREASRVPSGPGR